MCRVFICLITQPFCLTASRYISCVGFFKTYTYNMNNSDVNVSLGVGDNDFSDNDTGDNDISDNDS